MVARAPAAFNHINVMTVVRGLTAGVSDIKSVDDSLVRLFENLVSMIKGLQNASEMIGHAPEVLMDGLDNISDALLHQNYRIIAEVLCNTELDDDD